MTRERFAPRYETRAQSLARAYIKTFIDSLGELKTLLSGKLFSMITIIPSHGKNMSVVRV